MANQRSSLCAIQNKYNIKEEYSQKDAWIVPLLYVVSLLSSRGIILILSGTIDRTKSRLSINVVNVRSSHILDRRLLRGRLQMRLLWVQMFLVLTGLSVRVRLRWPDGVSLLCMMTLVRAMLRLLLMMILLGVKGSG